MLRDVFCETNPMKDFVNASSPGYCCILKRNPMTRAHVRVREVGYKLKVSIPISTAKDR